MEILFYVAFVTLFKTAMQAVVRTAAQHYFSSSSYASSMDKKGNGVFDAQALKTPLPWYPDSFFAKKGKDTLRIKLKDAFALIENIILSFGHSVNKSIKFFCKTAILAFHERWLFLERSLTTVSIVR